MWLNRSNNRGVKQVEKTELVLLEERNMEEKCLKCGGVLFEKVYLDDKGHTAMNSNSKVRLESDGTDQFFRCPHCSAKNVVVQSTSPHGLPQLRVSHVKPA